MRLRRALLLIPATVMVIGLLSAPAQAAPIKGVPIKAGGGKLTLTSSSSVKTQQSCAAAAKGFSACFALKRTDVQGSIRSSSAAISAHATPYGLAPADLQKAYALPAGAGAGQTVAIVDAFNDPTAAADLAAYRAQYGLPPCTVANGCFKQVNQNGATSPLPANNSGWAGEISLDLDMVSATCPACKILLVEASSNNNVNLFTAVNQAVSMGAKFVSLSWGGGEYAGESTDDRIFNHPGVAITVAAGDNGAGAEYPASSPYITAVGGTRLLPASNARGWAETVWSGTGSGCSRYEVKPSWQTVATNCARRANADVSAVADPATGVAVYQTYGASGWQVYGGTSAAAPIIAAVYALAGAPAADSSPGSFPYANSGSLNDVTSGTNGSCGPPLCAAGTNWDGPTGLGTPNGVAAFSASGGSLPPPAAANTVTVTSPGAQLATVGKPFSLQIQAIDSASGQTLSYAASGLPGGLAIDSSTGLISGTPTAAGTFSASLTVTDSTGVSGSTSFTTTVSAATGCVGAQLLGNAGFESGGAPWTQSAGVISVNHGGAAARSGTHFAWLDGYGKPHSDTLSQSVTIPAACTHTTLSFWLRIDTAERSTTTAYDKLWVSAGSTVLASYSNLNRGGYTQQTVQLGAFAGQTVTLTFTGVEDALLPTSFLLDDAAVSTS